MAKSNPNEILTIDGVEYSLDKVSDKAKEHLESLKFVNSQLQQLQNEWAVSDTARIGYINALKSEIQK